MSKQLPALPDTARAFATYSLVPYLGIVFCPGAVVVGGLGAVRATDAIGRRVSYISLSVGLVVLALQLFLWWILYKIPVWTQGL